MMLARLRGSAPAHMTSRLYPSVGSRFTLEGMINKMVQGLHADIVIAAPLMELHTL